MTTSHNRTAFVTGGSRGIGFGIAQSLAAEGWRLAINGMRPESDVQEPLALLRKSSPEVIYVRGDVSSSADRTACLQQIRSAFGQLHLLVNNARIAPRADADLLAATEESLSEMIDANLKGPYFLTQAVAKWMVEQRQADATFRGAIVNISPSSADLAPVNRGDDSMARAGIGMATKLWAVRLAEFGIHVYEIRPGMIATDITADSQEKFDRLIADGLTLEPRQGEPQDVGLAVAALARGEFSYATGQVIHIDGGMTIGRL
ncbi:3-ketoacyl-ACP reductase [Lacipirellula sp.]|uniref:3-ketoacyl-ACP reductase n=1 Tax=Lacipirellula sp. TaxID=2691419 RepID=UPI003D0EA7A5